MTRKAKARMLWAQISISPRVNNLSLKACLLYTWMIAHADDQGRMSAKDIKAIVCPMRSDIGLEDIPSLLDEIQVQRLIDVYQVVFKGTGELIDIVQILDWWEYQSLTIPRPSDLPAKEGWEDRQAKVKRDEAGKFKSVTDVGAE